MNALKSTLIALAVFIAILPPTCQTAWAASRPISIEWEKVTGSTGYELELVRIRNGRREAPIAFKSEGTSWKQELPVGAYELRLRSIDDRGVPGDWGAPSPYVVHLPAPVMKLPLAGADIKPVPRARSHSVVVEWEPVPGSGRYFVEILNSKKRPVDRLTSESLSYTRELPVGSDYTVRVAAFDEDGNRGDFASHEFTVMNSRQKPRYASAKFHRGRLNYSSANREIGGVITAQPAVSGVEVALEFKPEGLWDFGGAVDVSSYDFGIGTVSLLSAEAVVRRRIEALSGQAHYYAFGGLLFSETAELKGTSRADFSLGKVASVGPFIGMRRSGELTEKLNFELSVRLGASVLGVSVPNGMGLSPSISYRAEAAFLYRMRENLQGVFGVGYSGARTVYEAREYTGGTEQNFARPGDVNEISTNGISVSLGIGWGF